MKLYNSLVDRLKNQHETIEVLISKIESHRLTAQSAPGKWSIKDNVAHLAKYQPGFIKRINTILEEDIPVFERYRAENDPEFEAWRKKEINELLSILMTDRRTIFHLISNLSEQLLERTGIHKKYGRMTVMDWTEFFLLHEAHHIFTIFQLINDQQYKSET